MRRPALALALVLVVVAGCSAGGQGGGHGGGGNIATDGAGRAEPGTATTDGRCGGLWYAIGDRPTDAEISDAADRYGVVVLNAWEVDAMQRLKELNPDITVLVYKDLSSTRDYAGAVRSDGSDAEHQPTGIGFAAAEADNPEWFATDTDGNRIEWDGYPQHWQMTVWEPSYQRAWAEAVTDEVVEAGWDGVFADNDFATLRFYSDAVLAGTDSPAETDQLIRDGLDEMITVVGERLAEEGKKLVPNVSEARLYPGRWLEHSRFGGAMEENFAQRADDRLLTWEGAGWSELLETAADPDRLTLLVTAGDDRAAETGAAGAALLAGPGVCWSAAHEVGYKEPEWTVAQAADLGAPRGEAVATDDGVWMREYERGYAVVNPTSDDLDVELPNGLTDLNGAPKGTTMTVPAADGLVLVEGGGGE
ncbi:putative glycoside hydrolase [Pseudonocardia lacus]|uniref:putative glycoside hydrolase n=1 Tax=Pseudonocardia lacus TaxID=2835865 RepID=UPI001BDC8CC5|nr:putative glycoside hydrolase [Pseudonocardia lacus]